jgi:hypothetical protein
MQFGKCDMDNKYDQLIALHSTLVTTACASESKRQNVSIASAGLISAGITIFGADRSFSFSYLIFPLLILSSIWFVTVRFYQNLAKAKWEVVHEIESKLPFAPFTREWDLYKNERHFFTFGPSTLEQIIPAIVFIGTFGYAVMWLLSKIQYVWCSLN